MFGQERPYTDLECLPDSRHSRQADPVGRHRLSKRRLAKVRRTVNVSGRARRLALCEWGHAPKMIGPMVGQTT
jgi:hypothetical protein